MIKQLLINAIILGFIVCSQHLNGLVFGSDSAVAEVNTTQSLNNTDILNGFTAFSGGVTLASSAVSAYYNNYFPLYGAMSFANGVLNLSRNLTFGTNVTFSSGGSINGNSFSVNMPISTAIFFMPSMIYGNITLNLNSSILLTSVVTFTNTCVIEGNGFSIITTNGALAVGSGGSLAIRNATLRTANSRFYCYDDTGTVTLENVTCNLTTALTFSHGRIEFMGSNLFTGSQNYQHQSTVPATIHSNAIWAFDSGMTFSYATNSNSLLLFDDVTAQLQLYETTLYANTPGLALKKGTITLNGLCPFINDAFASAQGISIGDGVTSANNAVLNVLAESGINLTRGFFVNNNV